MKYIGYYDILSDKRKKRSVSLAGKNKMDYIIQCAAQCGEVEVISASGVVGKRTSFSNVERVIDNVTLRTFLSIGRKNEIIGKLGTFLLHLQLFAYLLLNIQRNENVIVYHSLGYMRLIDLAHRIKKFRLILEVEEIYSDVIGNLDLKEKELQYIRQADSYIFPTSLLCDVVNPCKKPTIIVHGTYQVEPDRQCRNEIWSLHSADPDDIHCVYAGTLDPRKGGAIAAAAAAAAEFLPDHYHVHILGFGSDREIQNMKDSIFKIASKSKAKVTYDGLLSGEDYIRFIQSCDIGLSTQNPDAAFNATSFPSKILSYLANGLRVVSIRIPAIEQSEVGDKLFYYDEQTSENIAKAILTVNMEEKYDSRKWIVNLSKEFEGGLAAMLEKSL